MFRRIYDMTLRLAEGRYALPALAAVAFVESSVFPIPPHVMMLPMILATPHRAWTIALVTTLASVAGGALGYWIGAVLFESVGQPVLDFYGKGAEFDAFALRFNDFGAWAVLMAGITPFPYKVITIASGATGLDFGVFMASSIVARGFIFFLLAAILWKFGPPVRALVERRFGLMTTLFFVILLGGFALVRWL
ncbi:DedA family protein [Halovulum dunhuangense]|uniref:DedA family protein n=1 Tax=Halovulum dunhuangense TaxID=1505036 RepID=A0A849L3I6_9RHOB|nr:YqaA family protein [Halovulum dunhuangense]NNU80958.1 DedA family protein [Halovulum dunhuangense]